MGLSKGIVTGGLVTGGIVAAWFFIKRMQRFQVNLEAIPSATLYKSDLSGVTIRVDVVIKNPTNGSVSIKFPFVKLIYKGATVGSSQVINKDIAIPQYGEVKIERIMITIPLLETFSVAYSLVKTLLNRKKDDPNKEQVKAGVAVITTATVGGISVPYNQTYDIPIV